MYDDETGRDRALDFHWRVDKAALYRAHVVATTDKRQTRVLASILACAVAAGSDGWVSYSRDRDFYAAAGRYQGLDYSYAHVLRGVGEAVAQGLIVEQRAMPGDHLRTGRQSRYQATHDLLSAFEDIPLIQDRRREPLVLRDENGRLVDYPETRLTRRMRQEIEGVRAYLRDVKVDLPEDKNWRTRGRVVEAYSPKRGGWASFAPHPENDIVRIFGRGRRGLDRHGRWYGWWQSIPKARRQELRINGEIIVEPDFTCLHPTLLYAMRGHVLRHDPYETGQFPRSDGKLALNIALNATSLNAAASSLMHRPGWSHGWGYTHDLLKAVVARNSAIARDIGADRGIQLMRIDSDMARDVMRGCEKAGIGVLPIHDSFIAPRSSEGTVTAIMADVLTATTTRLRASS